MKGWRERGISIRDGARQLKLPVCWRHRWLLPPLVVVGLADERTVSTSNAPNALRAEMRKTRVGPLTTHPIFGQVSKLAPPRPSSKRLDHRREFLLRFDGVDVRRQHADCELLLQLGPHLELRAHRLAGHLQRP